MSARVCVGSQLLVTSGNTQEKLLTGYFQTVEMEVWVGSRTFALCFTLYCTFMLLFFLIMSICCLCDTVIMIKWRKKGFRSFTNQRHQDTQYGTQEC
jgi:hypothetical protein